MPLGMRSSKRARCQGRHSQRHAPCNPPQPTNAMAATTPTPCHALPTSTVRLSLPSPHLALWQGYTKPGEMLSSTGLDSARHSDGDDDSDALLMEAGSRMAPFQIMHTRSATKDTAYA